MSHIAAPGKIQALHASCTILAGKKKVIYVKMRQMVDLVKTQQLQGCLVRSHWPMSLNPNKSGVEHGDQMKIGLDSLSKYVNKKQILRLEKYFCT